MNLFLIQHWKKEMPYIVDIRNVTVSYRENVALHNVSLSVEEGELVAIAGPNGAGKTTLLTVINGLGKLLSGVVKVFGIEVNQRNINQLRKAIGYVPQKLNIDPRMPITVREVVMIGRYGKIGLLRKANDNDKKVVDDVIDSVGIRHLLHRPIGHLSGGELQKVHMARALAQEPKILLLDEPTANLDLSAQKSILELIEKIHWQKQLTTFVVMHELTHLPQNCGRMILMKNAKIVFQGEPQKALSENILSEVYDCPVKLLKTDNGVIVRALTNA
ncbi:ABC transporter ATP-binding protein [candidate division KSB1 bacterium]|nr:MAG: ABC transporter ATP-binding protein [candidate division KSB1 bacterium]RKY81597.1 MAG: ABC transporter ATP-binding protein [candidate division KSB1 bacterium]